MIFPYTVFLENLVFYSQTSVEFGQHGASECWAGAARSAGYRKPSFVPIDFFGENVHSHQNWKRNWGNNREKKLVFFSQNFDSREENLFAKSHSIEKRKRNFLQNLEFREENENFVFKILTIENISRNEHSILQLEIEKNGPFPLEIFSRSRISSMPEMYLLH